MKKPDKKSVNDEASKPGEMPPPPRIIHIGRVRLDVLELDDKGERDGNPNVDDLVASLETSGQLQPIGVTSFGAKDPKKFRVIYGKRRVAAAKALHWDEIEAVEIKATSEDQVMLARSAENFDRDDLNPVEKAAAVAHLLDSIEPAVRQRLGLRQAGETDPITIAQAAQVREACIVEAAARLGKPASWVRDLSFLGRLEGKSRELVLDGRITVQAAREIAKVADPKTRDDVAKWAAGDPESSDSYKRPKAIEDVRRRVGESLMSLAQVPWKLDVPFAGAPACTNCPHNSANAPGLFERHRPQTDRRWNSGYAEPKAGVCTKRECFTNKSTTANRAARTAATRAVRAEREEKTPAAKLGAASAMRAKASAPEFVTPAAVTHVAQYEASKPPRGTAKDGGKKVDGSKVRLTEGRDWEAERKFGAALEDRIQPVTKAIEAMAGRDQCFLAAMILFENTNTYKKLVNASGAKGMALASSPEMVKAAKLVADRDRCLISVMEDLQPAREQDFMYFWSGVEDSALGEFLAKVVGIQLPPPPKLEDFKAKPTPPADKPAAKKSKAKPSKKAVGK